jgi:hypothetical protein
MVADASPGVRGRPSSPAGGYTLLEIPFTLMLPYILARSDVLGVLAVIDRTRGTAQRNPRLATCTRPSAGGGPFHHGGPAFENGPRGTPFSMVENGNGDGVRTRGIDQGIDL